CGKKFAPSPRQRSEALLDPFRRDARQSFELSAGFCFRLGDARYHRRHFAIFGLASKFKADTIGVIKVDAEQSRELRNRPNVVDGLRFEPRLNFAEALGRHAESAMLYGADGVAVADRLLPFWDLEEGEKAVITHIEEVMAHLFVRRIAAIGRASAETG